MSKRPLANSSSDAPHSPSYDLERRLLQLFINLHASDPTHDILENPQKGSSDWRFTHRALSVRAGKT
ncbi:hypothetical protein V1520DRAFT_357815, partial [Lipomyces starkeyi]